MDHLGNSLLVEHEIRRRQDAIAAAADRWGILDESSAAPPLRERVADLLVDLAHWLAPERNYTEIRRAAINHLAH